MKEEIQQKLDTGLVKVERKGTCSGYSWIIEWISTGGLQPLIEVSLYWTYCHLSEVRGLDKKFCLLPFNFLVVNGSFLKIGMNILWTFIYTLEKLRIDTMSSFLYVTSELSKDKFGTLETVKISNII